MAEKQRHPAGGNIYEPYNSVIIHCEIIRVLSAGKQTAPGPDEIQYEMLVHLSEPAVEALLQILTKY